VTDLKRRLQKKKNLDKCLNWRKWKRKAQEASGNLNELASLISNLRSEMIKCNKVVVALENEKLLTKRLWDQVHCCRRLLKDELGRRISLKLTDESAEELFSQIEQAFGFMKGTHAETRA
jgi:hypothetical protein